MSKSKLLIIGAFPGKEKVIYGGIAKSCFVILESSIANRFRIITLDSSQASNPPPKSAMRIFMAVRRLLTLIYTLINYKINVVLIFSSDGASAIEKGVMILICHLFNCPTLIFPRPKDEERIEFIISGRSVPIETSTKPIKIGGTFQLQASAVEESTVLLLEYVRKNMPKLNDNTGIINDIILIVP